MPFPRVRPGLLALCCSAALLAACDQSAAPSTVQVNLLALNDYHGHLLPSRFQGDSAAGEALDLQAGGAVALSGLLAQQRKADPQTLLVGVGDLVGGSPPLSSLWADEPTLEAMDLLGVQLSVVGNHELDQGIGELQRQIHGGCESPRPDKACQFDGTWKGIDFPYIAANLLDANGQPVLPAYHILEAHGARIAFVGAVLQDVASVVTRQGLQGLSTVAEAQAINALVPELLEQKVDAIVAVIHQGGETREPFDKPDCNALSGDIVEVVKQLDPHIRVALTSHTHQGYLCRIGDVLVTQGSSYGRLVTQVTLNIDTQAHRLLDARAQNLLVDPQRYDGDASASMRELVQQVQARSQTQLGKAVARIGATEVPVEPSDSGESPMGELIADAQLAATQSMGAQAAFMNLGGVRASLSLEQGKEQVDYGQVASVQPFNNTLVILDLTGAQLYRMLEEQWQSAGFMPLQPSSGVSYAWREGTQGERVVPDSLRIAGEPVDRQKTYRITVNSFMAEGGDNFAVLAEASARLDTGLNDLDALIDYLRRADAAGQPAGSAEGAGRIVEVKP